MILTITGITGSLAKNILKHQDFLKERRITKIIGLSRDEQKQVVLQREYSGDIPLRLFLGDVTDRERMRFALKNSNYVIHAAAQKHIDKFETDVPTGYKTNIFGTQYVSEGFMESFNAASGILVSTDKAALPTTTYGVSKLAAEKIWMWNNVYQKNTKMGVARFGNVFGSRGSILELWTEKAKLGQPLPITDLGCTRFFIELKDAAAFVLNSLFENGRKIHIPEMKSAYMTDVARVIWDYWQTKPLDLQIVGLRGDEKIHEILDHKSLNSNEAEKFMYHEILKMYSDWVSEYLSA